METVIYPAPILPVIERLAESRGVLALTRFFKGIHFKQNVQILAVEHGCAIVAMGEAKSFAVPQGPIHLHSRSFPKPVRANIVDWNIHKCLLVLSDFQYVSTNWQERSNDRVQPQSPTYLTLRHHRNTYRVALEDVESHGIGVLAAIEKPGTDWIQVDSAVTLDLHMHPDITIHNLAGTVINRSPSGNRLVRLGIRTEPRKAQSQALCAYISRRKEEILDELDRAYSRALEPRRVEDLYF